MKFKDINFNFDKLRENFLSLLKEEVSPLFENAVQDEQSKADDFINYDIIWSFTAKNKSREVTIDCTKNKGVAVGFDRENSDIYYCSKSMSVLEFQRVIPDIKAYLKNGKVNYDKFEKQEL